MFSIVRHFPAFELLFSNSALAFVITKQRQLKIYKIKPVLGKFFLADEGFFVLDPSKGLSIFKQRVYLYDASNINPLPVSKLAELEKLSKTKDYQIFMDRYRDIVSDVEIEEDFVNPVDPANSQALHDWQACDPQLIAVGTTHMLSIDKLLQKRSNSVVTKFPVAIIAGGIITTILLVVFGPQIMGMFDSSLGSMFGGV